MSQNKRVVKKVLPTRVEFSTSEPTTSSPTVEEPKYTETQTTQQTTLPTEEPKYNEATVVTPATPSTGDISYSEGMGSTVKLPLPPQKKQIMETLGPTESEPLYNESTTTTQQTTPNNEEQTSTDGETTGTTETEIDYTDTYAEFLKKQEKTLADTYESQLERIDAANQKAIADANAAYKQNMSMYGSRAESLADIGLTGSGYSEYLDAQSYAANRAEIQAANALKSEQQRLAEETYKSNLASNDEKYAKYKQAIFDNLLEGVNTGEYTRQQIETIGKGLGFTDAQLSLLTGAAENSISSDTIYEINNNPNKLAIEYTKSDLENLVAAGKLTQADADQQWEANNEAVYKQIDTILSSGKVEDITDALADLDKLKDGRNISQETYDKVQSLLTSSKVGLDYQLNTGKISPEAYIEQVEKLYNNGKSVSGKDITGGWHISSLGTGHYSDTPSKGDEIWLTLGSTEYNADTAIKLYPTATVDSALDSTLNQLATGNPKKYPSIEGEDWWGNSHVNSEEKPGKLVLYQDELYLYTAKGWRKLQGHEDTPYTKYEAIAKWISLDNSIKTK